MSEAVVRTPAGRPSAQRARLQGALLLALLVMVGWLAAIAWSEHRHAITVRQLPAAVQAATYRRTYDELSTTCVQEPKLADHCRRQAEFVVRFPQCDAKCEELARRFFPIAVK